MVVLTQAQNEAIVKLMLLARYQDKKLSLTEEAQFNQYLNELNWQAVTAVDTYAMRETTAVRKALDSAESTQAFMAQQNQVLDSQDAKNVLRWRWSNVYRLLTVSSMRKTNFYNSSKRV